MTGVAVAPPAHVLASPGSRLAAYLIDVVLATVVVVIPIVGILVAIAYALIKDALPFLNGQSIGKRAMGIRVVKEATGDRLTGDYGAAIVRQVALMIPIFNFIDALMVLRADHKRFGDQWAKTIVVREAAA
ncbi:MAG TPA: RDD family protein [Vicinamibacterales bacterium]|nr:RDD family protein [Vicinamibacterales bacterium]